MQISWLFDDSIKFLSLISKFAAFIPENDSESVVARLFINLIKSDACYYIIVGIFLLKFVQAFTQLRIVTGRKLDEFSYFDRRIIRRCLHMSAIAYKDKKKLRFNDKRILTLR